VKFALCFTLVFATATATACDDGDNEPTDSTDTGEASPTPPPPPPAPPPPPPDDETGGDDGPDEPPGPQLEYGETCRFSDDCRSGLCVTDGPDDETGACSEFCDFDDVSWCNELNAFCGPLTSGDFACYGEFEGDLGPDRDEAILTAGDRRARTLRTLVDADLFRIDYPGPGIYRFDAYLNDMDLALEVYNARGELVGRFDSGGSFEPERFFIEVVNDDAWDWVIVRNVGNLSGDYAVSLDFDTGFAANARARPIVRHGANPTLEASP